MALLSQSIFLIFFSLRCPEKSIPVIQITDSKPSCNVEPISCSINDRRKPGCYYINKKTVAVDFSFLEEWYEVSFN